MSQMKPYCFKCGAELDPDAIYCPECGRLQRSMVVRAVEPGGSGPAAAQPEQPYQYHPGQEAEPSQPAEHPPGQPPHEHDPYAGHQYADQGWYAGEAAAAGTEHDQHPDATYPHDSWEAQPGHHAEPAQPGGDQVHAQPTYPDPYAPGYEQPGYTPHEDPEPGYDPQYGHQQQPAHEQYSHPEPDHEQPGPHYGQLDQPGYQHEPQYEDPQTPRGEQEPAYGQHEPQYEHPQTAYGEQEPAYGQHPPPYEHPRTAYGEQEPAHGQHEPQYGDPQSTYGEQEPAYGQHEPQYEHPEPTYQHPEPGYGQAEPVYQPAEPVYRSSAPIPAGSGYSPQRPPAYVPEVNPYGPPPSEYAPPVAGPNRTRLYALLGAGLLGLLLIGFTIGQIITRGSGSPSAGTNPPRTQAAAPPPTSQPTAAPTAVPTPTAAQGTGNARFQKVSSDIPGSRCSTTQGCPITVTLKNNGDTGSGTVTVTLTDDAGNPVATFTGPIPSTDGGATVQVSGFATGDRLPTYLKSGGIVHITTIDVKNG
jgi:zinc-ribbon domain